MTIKVTKGSIRANGKSHGVGSELTLEIKEEKRLVGLGVAEFTEKPKKEVRGKSDKDKDKDPDKDQDKDQDKDADKDPDKDLDKNGEGGPNTGHPDIN